MVPFRCKLGLHAKETVYEDDYLRHEHCVKCDKHRLLSRSPRFGIDGAIAEGAMRGVYTGLNGWENLSRAWGHVNEKKSFSERIQDANLQERTNQHK